MPEMKLFTLKFATSPSGGIMPHRVEPEANHIF